MMALDKDGNKYIANKDLERKEYFYICSLPTCKQYVFLKKGDIKVAHFAHYTGVEHDWESESEEHYQMKNDIFEYFNLFKQAGWIKSIERELPIRLVNGNYLTPDIYIETNNNEKIAVECQYSIYSPEKIKNKTREYSESDIYTLWIFYNRDEIRKKHFKNAYNFLSPHFNADIIRKECTIQKYYMYSKTKNVLINGKWESIEINDVFNYITSLEILHGYFFGYDPITDRRVDKLIYFNNSVIFIGGCKLENEDDLKLIFSTDGLNKNYIMRKIENRKAKMIKDEKAIKS